MPERIAGAANIKLYDQGAEGYAIENGFDLYDIPATKIWQERDFNYGDRFEYTNRKPWMYDVSLYTPFAGHREPSIHSIEALSVVCPRPIMIQQDIVASDFNTFGGQWESVAPLRPPRKTRVVQYDIQKDIVVRAESKAIFPINPNISFSIQRLDSHAENDETHYPSKVQVILGDKYQVRYSDGADAGIWIKRAGLWQQEHHLGLLAKEDEQFCWVIVRRGVVLFSFNFGKEWVPVYGTDADLNIPSAQMIVEAVSCQFSIGLQQLYFANSWYETFDLPVLENHLGSPYINLTLSYRPLLTNLSAVVLPSGPGSLRYRVYFTPYEKIVSNLPFTLYDVPEVYATLIGWHSILIPAAGSYTDLAAVGVVEALNIDEEEQINQRSGSLSLDRDNTTAFTGSYGRRLIDIDLGFVMDDGSYDLEDRCVMYAMDVTPKSQRFLNKVQFDLSDLYVRAYETKVDGGWKPGDGLDPRVYRDYVMNKMGLPTSRRSWYASGAANLPNGLPDNPLWWPPEDTTAADIFAALDLWEGTETFIANDGTWTTRPYNYVDTLSSFTFQGLGINKDLRISAGQLTASHRDAKTAILLTSGDYRQGEIWATYIDYSLERSPATSGFIGYRIWEKYQETGVVTLAQAAYLINLIREQMVTVPYNLEEEVPGQPAIYRGQKITNDDAEMIGVDSADEFRVAALSFQWAKSLPSCRTTIRARRL